MTDAMYLRLKSLNTRTVRGVTTPKNIVRVAAMHNLREIQAEMGVSAASGINPARTYLNYQLRGPATADDVANLALALLNNAGVRSLRRDACMALELVISLPADTTIDHREYFSIAVAWADTYFNVPILSAAAHLDEAAPHCHILLLPLVAGRMQGGALAGGPAKIRAMLADFQQQVARRFGMTHQPRVKRLSKPNRDAAGHAVLEALRARPERLSEPAMRDALIAALGSQADVLLALLGLNMPSPKVKTKSFAGIMTAPCKPERPQRASKSIDVAAKSIDVASVTAGDTFQNSTTSILCIDVPSLTAAFPAVGQHQSADTLVGVQEAPAPLSTSHAALTSASTAPAKRIATKRLSAAVQAAAPTSADDAHRSAPWPAQSPVSIPHAASSATAEQTAPTQDTNDYQRQRDDDHPSACWDEQRGEFVSAPGKQTQPPFSARASPADIALDSIHALLALVGTTEHETPTGQKAEP